MPTRPPFFESEGPTDGRVTIACDKSGMQNELTRYDAACSALAEARSVDEVREILNLAEAQRAYAKMAKNRNLEADAFEIRKRPPDGAHRALH